MAGKDRSEKPPVSPDRAWRLARLGSRRVGDGIKTKWSQRSLDREGREELQRQYAIRTAEDVTREFGQMKGAVMKLGQLLSFQIDALPEPARRSLASLRADAPPMSPEMAAGVIIDELGAPPEELFAAWDPVPVAAASIGQVHRATLLDGRAVAVKVQYPGVADSIAGDLKGAKWLHRLVSTVAWRNLDVDSIVAELQARLTEEVDYSIEAERQRRFSARYRHHPFISIPGIVDEFSTARVLTSDWVAGIDWDDALEQPNHQRQYAAEAIFRFTQASIYRAHEFHGDPHPGNFLFADPLASGPITVLDFGLVKRLSTSDIDALWPIIDPVLNQDYPTVVARSIDAGFLPADHGLDPEHLWDYLQGPYVPFMADTFTYSPSFTQATLERMTNPRGEYLDVINAVSLPASFTVLDRVVWGTTALLGQLGAENRWRAILDEYRLDAPPATEMGEQEARWAAEQGGWSSIIAATSSP